MQPDELRDLVDNLRERINTHRDILTRSESTTRYALIDPILEKIGWRLEDPAHVLTEYVNEEGKRSDYTMWHGKKLCLVVEAKALGRPLSSDELNQAMNYCYKEGCQYFVVTNGDIWEGYDLYSQGNLREKRRFNFSVTGRQEIMELFWLWPGNFEGRQGTPARPKLHSSRKKEPDSSRESTSHEPLPSGVALPKFLCEPGMKPCRLVFPDGDTKDVSKSWASVQVATVEWLIDTKRLTRCPLKNKRTGTYLVNDEPSKKDGSKFPASKEVREGFWINTKFGSKNHLKQAEQMLRACDVDPSAVRIEV